MNGLQRLAAGVLARTDDDDAIQFEGKWHSWGDVREVAAQVRRLVDASGADHRAPVLFIARNIPAALAALLGLFADARSVGFLYSFQSPAAIAQDIARLKPGVLIAAEQDFAPEIVTALRRDGLAAVSLGDMTAHALPGLEAATVTSGHDLSEVPTIEIQTSGTTGTPKRFPVTYDEALERFASRVSPTAVTSERKSVLPTLLYMSYGNLSGLMGMLPPLIGGRPMILSDRFSLDGWRDYVRTYRPEHGGLAPTAINMLLEAEVPQDELSSLRSLVCGSAPLSAEAHLAFEERFGVPILKAYGATEFYGSVTVMTLEMRERWGNAKASSVGLPCDETHIRVVDEATGDVLHTGETGLLEVCQDFRGRAWTRTSDLASIDADGFLYIHGRADGAIIRGGFKLIPETIERALMEHDALAAVAVVGVADQRLGQVPAAAIQVKTGVTPPTAAELNVHLRQRVPATHIPVLWHFVDAFALTPSLKVDRGAVVRLLEDVRQG